MWIYIQYNGSEKNKEKGHKRRAVMVELPFKKW